MYDPKVIRLAPGVYVVGTAEQFTDLLGGLMGQRPSTRDELRARTLSAGEWHPGYEGMLDSLREMPDSEVSRLAIQLFERLKAGETISLATVIELCPERIAEAVWRVICESIDSMEALWQQELKLRRAAAEANAPTLADLHDQTKFFAPDRDV